ncbi:MAG: Wzz/FepE/Etk N-terminal domain-containing protein [Pseudomonadota bacterium]
MTYYRPMTGYAQDEAPAFQAEDFFRLLRARQTMILRVAAAIVLAAILIALALPTIYTSSAVVMLDPRKNNVTDPSQVLAQVEGDPASLQNQIQLLTSRGLAEKVIAKLKLEDDPEFNPALAPPGIGQLMVDLKAVFNPRNWFDDGTNALRPRDRILDNFAKHVSAGANGLSTAITVSATSRDASKAARIANEMANAYIADQIATKRNAAGSASTWLNQRIRDLSEQLQQQQSAIAAYKAVHGLSDSAPGSSLVDQQMTGINTQIVLARSELAEKQAQSDRVQALMRTGNSADVAQVISSPLIVQLRTQQADLIRQEGELSTQYGPLHPKMKALHAEKTDLDQKIAQEVSRLAGSIASDVSVARAHLNSLEASLKSVVQQQTSQNMSRVQLDALQANAASTRTQYETFVGRLRQTQDQDSAFAADSRVISAASPATAPSSPRRSLIVLASVPLGLLLGVMAALLSERFGFFPPAPSLPVPSGPRNPPRPQAMRANANAVFPPARMPPSSPVWSGPPVIADIPNPVTLKAGDVMLDQPGSPYAYRMAALVRRLQPHDGAAVVAMTSAVPDEGKSAIGISLARAAASMGKKVILLDCDPAQTSQHAMHVAETGGLYDVLSGLIPLNKVLTRDPRSDAFVLTMSRQPPNMATMFGSQQMKKLIRLLRDNCDMVVMDCARAATPETWLLARLCDATLLVSRKNALNTPGMAKSVRILHAAKVPPLGLIVTR